METQSQKGSAPSQEETRNHNRRYTSFRYLDSENYWIHRKRFVPESNLPDEEELIRRERELNEELGKEVQQMYRDIVSQTRKRRRVPSQGKDQNNSKPNKITNNNNNDNNSNSTIENNNKSDNNNNSNTTISNSNESKSSNTSNSDPSNSNSNSNNNNNLHNNLPINNNEENSYYCPTCEDTYQEPLHAHLRSVPHQLSENFKSATPLPPKSYHLNESNKGFQMLKGGQLGEWNEDVGLGASNQGRLDPLKTQLKSDRKGVGHRSTEYLPTRVTHFPRGQNPKLVQRGVVVDDSTSKKTKKRLTKTAKKIVAKMEKERENRIRNTLWKDDTPYSELLSSS